MSLHESFEELKMMHQEETGRKQDGEDFDLSEDSSELEELDYEILKQGVS